MNNHFISDLLGKTVGLMQIDIANCVFVFQHNVFNTKVPIKSNYAINK